MPVRQSPWQTKFLDKKVLDVDVLGAAATGSTPVLFQQNGALIILENFVFLTL
jgi:hypothetical protein